MSAFSSLIRPISFKVSLVKFIVLPFVSVSTVVTVLRFGGVKEFLTLGTFGFTLLPKNFGPILLLEGSLEKLTAIP